MSLAQVFDRRRNALTLWRLLLAMGVVFWHSWPLTGREIDYAPAVRLLSDMFADGFFIISGFLITAAWLRRPHLKEYWASRFLRIFPGLWVCLAVIAFIAAPFAAKLTHSTVTLSSEVGYLLNNAVLNIAYLDIDGTPADVPYSGVWNGSIWTLFFVLLCDLMVSVLGVIGLLKRQWTIPILFVAAVCWCAYVSYTPPGYSMAQMLARFAVVFLAGAMFHRYQHKIPANWWLVGLSAAIVVASSFTHNYRVIGALPLAYAIIVSGALVKRSRLRNDLSYGVYIYAFPVQQLLATMGMATLNPLLFFGLSTAAVMPVAAGSWFLVEKRASNLRARIFRKSAKPVAPEAHSDVAAKTGN